MPNTYSIQLDDSSLRAVLVSLATLADNHVVLGEQARREFCLILEQAEFQNFSVPEWAKRYTLKASR